MTDSPPSAGRKAACWLLWLGLIHFCPVIWFMFVAAGLAPTALLFGFGLAGLFNTDSGSGVMALVALVPALLYGAIFWGIAYLFCRLLWRMTKPYLRSTILMLVLGALVVLASQPIYVSYGHSSSYHYTLLQLIDEFASHLPTWLVPGYLCGLSVVGLSLFVGQHTPAIYPTWSIPRRRRRQIIFALLVSLLIGIGYTHRLAIFIRPLALMDIAAAQYYLAMSMRDSPGAESMREWLTRAAAQGHVDSAMQLSRIETSGKERLRWLRVAAESGHEEAQYRLYQILGNAKASAVERVEAARWLRRSAESGYPQAQYELGRYAFDGRNRFAVGKDVIQARKLLELAAQAGSGDAMRELAWRYAQAENGFPLDLNRAADYYQQLSEGYADGAFGLRKDLDKAGFAQQKADEYRALQQRLDEGDPATLAEFGLQQLKSRDATAENRQQALSLLRRAAGQGDAEVQYQLGFILLNGRNGVTPDLAEGRGWWDKAARQNHVQTMQYLAKAYQSGQFGYPVDLLKANQFTEKLVSTYRDGLYGVEPDANKLRQWQDEEKHFQRIAGLSGGYLSPAELRTKAQAGDLDAQYQLARQQLLSGHQPTLQEGLSWLEKAAEAGLPEAQYRLVTYYQTRDSLIRNDPQRGVRLLSEAGEAGHLRALSTLALAYEKGRYDLPVDRQRARELYRQLLRVYATGEYLGDIDERFIGFQKSRLEMLNRLLKSD